ncbi:MAG: transcription elongation factor GreA [Planctomycetes bacterium]|nr:transcription elongation factor GreA [Planctomycetota bacterium]
MVNLIPISKTGYDKLKEELSDLEIERAEVSKRVGIAREMGDLKENGEYIYGRERLGFIDGRLGELRGSINLSEVVDCTAVQCDKANFGTVVTLLDLNTEDEVTYQLLGPNDADFDNGSISFLSPVGDAIYDLAVGEKSSVTIPRGEFSFEIIDITKSDIA